MSVNLSDPKLYTLIDEDVRQVNSANVAFSQSTAPNQQVNLSGIIPEKGQLKSKIPTDNTVVVIAKDDDDVENNENYRKEKRRLRMILICFCLVLILCIFLTIRRWMLAYKICGQKNNKLDCAASLSPEISALGFAAVSLL